MIKAINRLKKLSVTFLLILSFLVIPTTNVEASQSKASNFSTKYELTKDQAANVVAIAKAQLGKTKRQLGYTEAWCGNFVSDCAQLAGVSKAVPFTGRASSLYKTVLAAGGKKVKKAKAGDLVFYHCKACGRIVHTGIMIDKNNSVEGNYSGKVSLVGKKDYVDARRHRVKGGTIVKKFVRPNYQDGESWNVSSAVLKKGTSTSILVAKVAKKDKVANYMTSNSSVVKVSKKGKISAKKTGVAYVTAVLKSGKTAVIKIKVQKKAVKTKNIILSAEEFSLENGQSINLEAQVKPITSVEGLEFLSSDENVVTVDEKGAVVATGAGEATITVMSGDVQITVNITVCDCTNPVDETEEI